MSQLQNHIIITKPSCFLYDDALPIRRGWVEATHHFNEFSCAWAATAQIWMHAHAVYYARHKAHDDDEHEAPDEDHGKHKVD